MSGRNPWPPGTVPVREMWLERFVSTSHGTFGRLWAGGKVRLFVCEEEDQQNRTNISRIPAGTYTCRRSRFYAGGYETFEVTGVPGRSRILFHKGNTEEDSAGCILTGLGLGVLERVDEDLGKRVPKLAVTSSTQAFASFMALLAHADSFQLRITDPEA